MIPYVSVIVPVYNIAPYLERCLNSLLCQTLKNIEIILVDDGSTDGSGKICDRYAAIDDRITVIHHNNRGISAARNEGIRKARAGYLMFVDGDDWVEPSYCEVPFHLAQKHHADLVFFGAVYEKSGKVKGRTAAGTLEGLVSIQKAIDLIYSSGCGTAWNKLYHRNLFSNIRFPNGKTYEDIDTIYKLVHSANKIYYTPKQLYHYTLMREGSITSAYTEKKMIDEITARKQRGKELESLGYGSDYWLNDALTTLIKFGRISGLTDEMEFVLKRAELLSVHLTWKRKCMLALYWVSPVLFDTICIISGRRVQTNG